jgi:hypothetical protein
MGVYWRRGRWYGIQMSIAYRKCIPCVHFSDFFSVRTHVVFMNIWFPTKCMFFQLWVGTGAVVGIRLDSLPSMRSCVSIPPVTGVICVRVVRTLQSLCALARIRCGVESELLQLACQHTPLVPTEFQLQARNQVNLMPA